MPKEVKVRVVAEAASPAYFQRTVHHAIRQRGSEFGDSSHLTLARHQKRDMRVCPHIFIRHLHVQAPLPHQPYISAAAMDALDVRMFPMITNAMHYLPAF